MTGVVVSNRDKRTVRRTENFIVAILMRGRYWLRGVGKVGKTGVCEKSGTTCIYGSCGTSGTTGCFWLLLLGILFGWIHACSVPVKLKKFSA